MCNPDKAQGKITPELNETKESIEKLLSDFEEILVSIEELKNSKDSNAESKIYGINIKLSECKKIQTELRGLMEKANIKDPKLEEEIARLSRLYDDYSAYPLMIQMEGIRSKNSKNE